MKKNKFFKKSNLMIIVLAISCCISAFSINVFSEGNDGKIQIDNLSKASAIYLYNIEKDLVLAEKNSKMIIDPASTVKLMTSIVAFDSIENIDSSATITQNMIGNTNTNLMNLKVGEIIKIRDLFIGMLCCGYNDAAQALAVLSYGSIDKFVNAMNLKAQQLGALDTFYTDVTGVGDGAQSTAYDTMLISKEFIKHETLLEISDMPSHTISRTNMSDERKFHNRNALISNYTGTRYLNSFAQGMNFGMTGTGGYSVVTSAEKEGIHYICIVLNGDYDKDKNIIYSYLITNQLLDYVEKNLGFRSIAKKGDIIGNITVKGAPIKTEIANISVKQDVSVYLPSNYNESGLLKCSYIYSKAKLTAPVAEGTCVGKIVVSYGDEIVAVEDMIIDSDIERDNFMYSLELTRRFLSSKGFICSIIVFAISMVIYIFHGSKTYKNMKRKSKRKRNNYIN